MAALVARFHHERFDGRGYPVGLRGTEIPLPARIVALADAYDAITSARPYKAPLPASSAREIVQRDSGSHFDPVVVEAFLRRFDTVVSVQKQTEDRVPIVIGANALRPEHLAAVGAPT
jgi:HD-GYP domain-containing protein (c-di-GMP phosphodiesterase class II)